MTPTTFWARVDKTDACWLWTGPLGRGGYGRVSLGKVTGQRYAHRVAYELEVGPIPDGLTLDHLCKVRACVNPAHLEPVTHRTNVLRGDGPTARNAAKTHCPLGHAFTPDNTITTSTGSRLCRTCRNAGLRERRLQAMHEQGGPSVCSTCGGRFATPKGVVTHRVRRHSDDRPAEDGAA